MTNDMKTFHRILSFLAAILSAGLFFGCTQTMDEIGTLELRRCLEPMNLSAKVTNGDQVTFNWDVTKDATQYNLVVYTDKEMTKEYFSTTLDPSQVPFTKALEADATYYYKVQAVSSNGLDDSNWAVYDKQENKMLTLAVWDLDATMGQSFSHEPPPHPPYVSYDSWPMLPTKIGLQLFIFNHLQFRQSIADRYFNLRKDVFSFANLFGRFQACYDFISGCGSTTREERRWSGDSDIEGLKLDFREELAFIYEWLDQRLQHLDRFFSDPVSVRNIPTAPTLDKMVTPFGAPVEPSYHGIVITQGRKYMFNHRQN